MSSYVELTPQEVSVLLRVTTAGGIEVEAPEFKHASASARRHKERHGSLDGWELKNLVLGAELARIDREASAKRKAAIKAAGIRPRYASASEVQHMLKLAHDACMNDGPRPRASALLREAGVPDAEVSKLASRRSLHTEKVWAALACHPARQTMREHGVLSRRNERGTVSSSLAGTVSALYSFADHAKDKQRLVSLERRVQELETYCSLTKVRHKLEDAGLDAKAVALKLYQQGKGYKAIAASIGRANSTVRNWVKAAEKAI